MIDLLMYLYIFSRIILENFVIYIFIIYFMLNAIISAALAQRTMPPLSEEEAAAASAHYQQYCALCHGADRAGYANDNAPSLLSPSLYTLGTTPVFRATAFGRIGTPMGPYVDDLNGPMSKTDIRNLARWMSEQAGVAPPYPTLEVFAPIEGDIALGEKVYARECADCHGAEGEGGEGTALGNQAMLAMTPDSFLRLAIAEGREGTAMRAYKDTLSDAEIDGVTAFLRSRAEGWDMQPAAPSAPPTPAEYVLNPDGAAPAFTLSEDRYIDSAQLNAALESRRRIILLDTRLPYLWATGHIRGSIPIPYYSNFDEIVEKLPDRETWIVAYCECPRAASNRVVDQLRERGFNNTAVIWEGYGGWVAKGYPSVLGDVSAQAATATP